MDFYAVLGIPRNADETVIRQAYRSLARRFHPDSGAGSSPEKFREVAAAYETLIDPSRRQGYDLWLRVYADVVPARIEPLHVEPMVGNSPFFFRQENYP